MSDEARKLIERIGDWDRADHYEDCKSLVHSDGDCGCTDEQHASGACEDAAEEACDCYLGVMRTARATIRALLDSEARLRERLDQFDAYGMPNVAAALDRIEAAEAKVRELEAQIGAWADATGKSTPAEAEAEMDRLEAERDEARATKDMHKERQQEEIERRLVAEAELAAAREQNLKNVRAYSEELEKLTGELLAALERETSRQPRRR